MRAAISDRDVGAAMEIRRQAWPAGFGEIWSAEEMDGALSGALPMHDDRGVVWGGEPQILLAEHDHEPAGMAMWRSHATPSVAEVVWLYTHPLHQGHGVGTAVWETVLHEVRNGGFTEVQVWVLKRNGRAVRFYERLGCTRFGSCNFTIGNHAVVELGYRVALQKAG